MQKWEIIDEVGRIYSPRPIYYVEDFKGEIYEKCNQFIRDNNIHRDSITNLTQDYSPVMSHPEYQYIVKFKITFDARKRNADDEFVEQVETMIKNLDI